MDKKTKLQNLTQLLKDGLKANNPITDNESDWISVVEACDISEISRGTLYNLLDENWIASKKVPYGTEREKIMVFKPHILSYSLHTKIIDELVKIGYYKEDTDQITGKKRWLELQLEANKTGNRDSFLKNKALFETYLKLADLFRNVDMASYKKLLDQ